MKKLRYLPLLGVALLALTGCSSNNEISHKKAQSLYNQEAALAYQLRNSETKNSLEPASEGGAPTEVVAVKGNTEEEKAEKIAQITTRLCLTELYGYLSVYHIEIPDNTSFFFDANDENFYQLAHFFLEKPTYTLDGKKLTTNFTGSTKTTIEATEYGLAMHFEAKYNKVGLIYESSYELVVTTDLNKTTAETVLRYEGSITADWTIPH